MARGILSLAIVLAVLAWLAPGAQARTPCPSELDVPTAQNGAMVSDAIFCLTNQIRGHYGLPAVRRDARLDTAARLHSEDMARRGFFSHTNPEGQTPGDRAVAQGYPSGATAENIALGYESARAVMIGWIESRGHCRNLLSKAVDVGIGVAVSSKSYFALQFGDFSATADKVSREGCPHKLDLDAIAGQPLAAVVAPVVAPVVAAVTAVPPPAVSQLAAVVKPAVSAVALSRSRFPAGGNGTTISYTLSAAAPITLRIERRLHGRRAGGRCARTTRSNRTRKKCTRYKMLNGGISQAGVAGPNKLKFNGRLRGKKLKPGRYRLVIMAPNAAPMRSRFEITRTR